MKKVTMKVTMKVTKKELKDLIARHANGEEVDKLYHRNLKGEEWWTTFFEDGTEVEHDDDGGDFALITFEGGTTQCYHL